MTQLPTRTLSWMIRSFALTYAALTLRLGLGVLPLAGLGFLESYRTMSVLSWVINLAVAELYLARRAGRQAHHPAGRLQPQKTVAR